MHLTQPMLAAGLLFSLTTLNAEAALTPYTSAGENLVYSSVSNLTWTQDANLFKTLYDADNTLVNQIASVTPSYNDSYWGVQDINAGDFNIGNGKMTWWGANAFVNYLNSISYGGSSQWRLPTVGTNRLNGYYQSGSELGQLFYAELKGTYGGTIPNTSTFNNELLYSAHWSSTENVLPGEAGTFRTYNGSQGFNYKDYLGYAWAVSPGQVTAVPIPGAVWLFGTGLVGLLSLKRRGHAGL